MKTLSGVTERPAGATERVGLSLGTEQPEIKFVNKLIRMRISAERLHKNRKFGVMGIVFWLKKHIEYNGYKTPEQARSFIKRHYDKILYIIPSGKEKLINEFKNLIK